MNKAIRNTIITVASLAGIFFVACSLSDKDSANEGTAHTSINDPSE